MKIGLLESRLDPFINDLQSRLSGLPVEFISFSQQPLPLHTEYGVVVDRLSFLHPFLEEMLKNLALNGAYVINNPFAATATNKMVELRLCGDLGISFPRTVVLPDITAQEELGEILDDLDWQKAVQEVGLPCVIKPYDGSGWKHVYRVNSMEELQGAYEKVKHRHVVLVQQAIDYKDYFRVFCIGKRDVLFIKWVPRPLAMGEYLPCDPKELGAMEDSLTRQTIQLNKSLDLDVNAVEWCLDREGRAWLIEAFNEVPDIDKRSIPQPYYDWIVEKFAGLVKQKFYSTETNRTILGLTGRQP
ncbi:MAG: hypothetical protein HY671_12660 [Chloroflexi bacterium]|nr:hypothetical protein [Chloroflexota bacterium]